MGGESGSPTGNRVGRAGHTWGNVLGLLGMLCEARCTVHFVGHVRLWRLPTGTPPREVLWARCSSCRPPVLT